MWRAVGAVTAAAIVFAVILSIGSPITSRPEAQHHGLWEPLELYWLLPTQLHRLPGVMRFLDLAGIAGAIYLFYGSPSKISRDRSPGPEVTARVFLAVTGISLLLLHLSYVQLNDTYITALIPFAILIATDRIDARRLSNALFRWSVAVSALLILLTAVWMRSEYAGQEAYWRSADALVRAGVCPDDIEAPLHWAEYHGGFDAWIAAGAPGFSFSEPSTGGRDALHDPFYSWINNRMQYASFRIVQGDPGTDPAGWHVIDCVQFRNAAFGRRWIVTLKRNASLPVTSVEKCENQLP